LLLRGALLALALLGASSADAAQRRYALVIGNSTSLTPNVRPLEFADDDAARYAELFGSVADRVQLLTVLDPDAQRIHPELARKSRPPDRKNVMAALDELYLEIQKDRQAGHEVVFYFILIGHGEIGPGGEGFVSLLDAPFSRGDLYQQVIARSPATTNHVIVDACNSYFLVNRRGADDGGPSRAEAIQSYLSREDLASYPNTGVVLSTSSAKESHEWSAYRAGVFSHEVRSAMTGAADANTDGRVDYSEVHAFVAAANLRVDDPRARIDLFVRPPAIDVRLPLVDLRHARFSNYLSVPAGEPAHFYLEDDRGVRYADVNLSGENATYLALVDRDFYWVRDPDDAREGRFDLDGPGRVELDVQEMKPRRIAVRGAIGDTFQAKLFREPYGPEFYRGFAAAHGYVASSNEEGAWIPLVGELDTGVPAKTIGSIAFWSAAAALAGIGVFAEVRAARSVAEFERHVAGGAVVGLTREEADELQREARTWSWARNGLFAGSAATLIAGLVLWLWPDGDATPALSVSTDGTSVLVGGEY
jgi:hypothetical protein